MKFIRKRSIRSRADRQISEYIINVGQAPAPRAVLLSAVHSLFRRLSHCSPRWSNFIHYRHSGCMTTCGRVNLRRGNATNALFATLPAFRRRLPLFRAFQMMVGGQHRDGNLADATMSSPKRSSATVEL